MSDVLLRIDALTKRFGPGCDRCLGAEPRLNKNYCPVCGSVHALSGVSLDVRRNEVVGIVGESGSGKSTLMKCLYFDQSATSGAVYLDAVSQGRENVLEASGQRQRAIRNSVLGMVYQNPADGLQMDFSALANIAEKLIAAGGRSVDAIEDRAGELLGHVNLPLVRWKEAPRHFSGGMRQRVQIAKALSNRPPLLLLDEVTTGLDLSVQAKVLDLIRALKRELAVGMLLVSHDLGVVRMLADRTVVMLDGRVVEEGLTDQIMEDPQHPYTQELVQSLL